MWNTLRKGPQRDCIRLIRMGHTENQLRPKYKGAIGTRTHNNRGASQGSPLSAMLFIIYFDRMMEGYTQNLQQKYKTQATHIITTHPWARIRLAHLPLRKEIRKQKKLYAHTMTTAYTKQPNNRATITFMPMT